MKKKFMDEVFEHDRLFWFMMGAVVQSNIPYKEWKNNTEEILQQIYGQWIENLNTNDGGNTT